MKAKQVEIFWGNGGVGKTTLAASRALVLAEREHKTLLITIDPSGSLKRVLQLSDPEAGTIVPVPQGFDALLFSPAGTLKKVLGKDYSNRIVEIITHPYGGMNELMATVELQYHLESKRYDTIVLDTPPGKHFIDFMESAQKIGNFFDKKFVEAFCSVGANGIINKLIKTGAGKVIEYLERMTGSSFVEEFVKAIGDLYQYRQSFLKAIELQENLSQIHFCNSFFVVKPDRLPDKHNVFDNTYVLFNQCLGHHLREWNPQGNKVLEEFKKAMQKREIEAKKNYMKNLKSVLEFPEIPGDILRQGPHKAIIELANHWPIP